MRERLQDLLSSQSELRPEATALVFRGGSVTYGQLEQASNRMARALRAIGCGCGDRIALLLPKSPRALMAIFGVLKAGCIYVPVDPASPPARIERILRVCDCRCLVAEQSTAPLIDSLSANNSGITSTPVLWMDGGGSGSSGSRLHWSWKEAEVLSDARIDSRSVPSDVAHILFTSGSTGMPKGVPITHSSILHFVTWAVRYFGITQADRVSGHPPLHFDLSGLDIYGAMAAGAQVHLLSPETSLLPHRLAEFIRDSTLTQWFSVPSALLPIAKFDALRQNDFPELRRLLWCGERFPTPALRYWMRRLPHVGFFNLYGPTETTIASSCYRVPGIPENDNTEISIGAPCDGERLLVLDDQMLPARPGEIGNLYIGGIGLSSGYWNDPSQTEEVFRSDPEDASSRIYKTGDLARIGTDGLIYLIGRADSQIKSRGFRIELGEIEKALHSTAGVQDGAVVAVDSADGVVICCAYVPLPGVELAPASVKKQLARDLPHYMVPSRWAVLERMPHNANGKTDRVLLKLRFCEETDPKGLAAEDTPTARSQTYAV